MAMNKWVKRKWVRALRSGEYKQVQGLLFDDQEGKVIGYCCLAVVMAEMHPTSFDGRTGPDLFFGERVLIGGDSVDGKVADDLAILWGLDEDTQELLANMNDDGQSFPVIADWIEENL
jgi:hypothetical protein